MVAARAVAGGLSPADLDGIRETLTAGRRPKVMFTEAAGQIAGQVGQVVRLADPAAGDEFVVVRFGRDELPFSPADLTIPPRGAARRVEPAASARSEPNGGRRAGPNGTGRAASPASTVSPGSTAGSDREKPAPVPAPRDEPAAPPAPATASGPGGAAPAREPRKAGRPARPKPPAGLTVTLAYTDGEWMVSATQGAKSLAKPYLIKPAEALRMVTLLDVPGVQEAVEHIVAAERAVAQEQAERLRGQLAEVEARLAELGELG